MNYFFITEQDPDYRPKGSRDPLGFQVIWQSMARNVIPYLSTVSSNINDFHILGLAHLVPQDSNFVPYFFKIEQLFGYARVATQNQEKTRSFNGIEQVIKKWGSREEEKIQLSDKSKDLILSDQKTYGILGKYSRPFRDMNLRNNHEFNSLLSEKISNLKLLTSYLKSLEKKGETEICDTITLNECSEFLKLNDKEIEFFCKVILSKSGNSGNNKLQPKFYDFLKSNELEFSNSKFYEDAIKFYENLEDKRDKEQIQKIIRTELILSRLTTLFSHLQSYQSGIITKEMIQKDAELFQSFKLSKSKYGLGFGLPKDKFSGDTDVEKRLNLFISILEMDNPWEIALKLVEINQVISKKRKTYPWITEESGVLRVHLRDGANECKKFEEVANNRYFLDTYVSLFKQLNTKEN